MATIGYGDISPKSNNEKIFAFCMALMACGIFAFLISIIRGIWVDEA